MAVLNSVFAFLGAVPASIAPSIAAPGKMWHLLILNVFSFVADYGWRIVVFTLLLKLVLSPLDFFQRYKMHKNQKITERLKPTMEKIQKQYGGDKQAFSQKQMELNRKEGYSYFSACLPMIVTLVVFITLWISMQTIAQYMTFKEYITMYDEYQYVTYQIYDLDEHVPVVEGENKWTQEQMAEHARMVDISKRIGQDVVYQMYYYGLDESYTQTLKENAEYKSVIPSGFKIIRDGTDSIGKVQASFLWIKNIWSPDVPWGDKGILDWAAFEKGVNNYKNASTSGLSTEQQYKAYSSETYEEVMYKLLNDQTQSRTNGYLILPILVVLLSVGSQLLSMMQQKRAGQVNAQGGTATSMKIMMFIMPVMMAVFALQYASIFALYMVINSAMTLLLNVTFGGIIKLIDNAKRSRNYGIATGSPRKVTTSDNSPIIHYVKGANPNAGARETAPVADDLSGEPTKSKKTKKEKTEGPRVIQRGGRPDPNDLMGVDMSKNNNKKR